VFEASASCDPSGVFGTPEGSFFFALTFLIPGCLVSCFRDLVLSCILCLVLSCVVCLIFSCVTIVTFVTYVLYVMNVTIVT